MDKRIFVPFVALLLAALACGGTAPTAEPSPPPPTEAVATPAPTDTAEPTPETKAPGAVGETIERSGISLAANSVRLEEALGEFWEAEQGKIYLVVDVTIGNVSRDGSTPYNPFYFKTKDSDGYEYSIAAAGTDKRLKSGELAEGETVRGEVAFEVPAEASGFMLSYEPLMLLGGYEPIKVNLGY